MGVRKKSRDPATPPDSFVYLGRNDGLGNRLEEIIVLSALATKYGCDVTYLFHNVGAREDRSYDILFDLQNPRVTLKVAGSSSIKLFKIRRRFDLKNCLTVKDLASLRSMVSSNDIRASARKITPKFDFESFPDQPIAGFHIRASDRIAPNAGPHFLKSRSEMTENIGKCLAYLKSIQDMSVMFFSDEPQLVVETQKSFTKIEHRPSVNSAIGDLVPDEYRDLFALSRCSLILLAGAPSSFCLVAAMIGGVPVAHGYLPDEFRDRYPVDYISVDAPSDLL